MFVPFPTHCYFIRTHLCDANMFEQKEKGYFFDIVKLKCLLSYLYSSFNFIHFFSLINNSLPQTIMGCISFISSFTWYIWISDILQCIRYSFRIFPQILCIQFFFSKYPPYSILLRVRDNVCYFKQIVHPSHSFLQLQHS